MKNVSFKIDGIMVLTLLGTALAGWLYYKRKALANAINPASDENLIYKGVQGAVGKENLSTAADYFFGAIDLLNPFNESDTYARQVYGLEKVEQENIYNEAIKE